MTRFRTIRIFIVFSLLVSGLLSHQTGRLVAQEPDLTFGVIADCQYCDIEGTGVRKYSQSPGKLDGAVSHLNGMDLDFVIHLGDFIDRDYESFRTVLPIWDQLQMPAYHVLGNHDFSVEDQYKSSIHTLLNMPTKYYDFQKNGWRFIVLDGNDVSLHAYPEGSEEHQESVEYYEQYAGDSPDWNGALGKQQLVWLESVLQEAKNSGQSVILFSHFPVYPENRHNLWNASEIIDLIETYPNVKMYMNGHNHAGNYGQKNDVHYLTLKGMVDTDTTSYAVVRLSSRTANISGFGRESDRTLNFDN